MNVDQVTQNVTDRDMHLLYARSVAGRDNQTEIDARFHPAAIPPGMARRVERLLRSVRFGRADVRRFLGEYLSAPKPQIVFSPPRAPLGGRPFKTAAHACGLRLDPRTLLLFDGERMYVNGEAVTLPLPLRAPLRALADCRTLSSGAKLPGALCSLLHRWYLHGWLLIGERHA